jgi:hypothetical protein
MSAAAVRPEQRHRRRNPCRLCYGHDDMPRGHSKRCAGWTDEERDIIHCERIPSPWVDKNASPTTYAHRGHGQCVCGTEHSPAQLVRPAAYRSGKSPLPRQQPRQHQDRRIVATYDYCKDGQLRYQAVRYDPKGFSQRQPDGNGRWIWSLVGVERVVYHREKVLGAPAGDLILHLEGEKDVHQAEKDGFIATTTAQGAKSWHQTEEDARLVLRGRDVVIVPDADNDGDSYAESAAAGLVDVAASVRIVHLPGLEHRDKHGDDYSDWRNQGHTRTELLQLILETPPWHPDAEPEEPTTANTWDELVPLPGNMPPVDAFDMEMMPAPLRGWIHDIAERMQVPVDFLAIGAIVEAAALIGRRIGIYPKRRSDWLVVPNLWGAAVGPPSVKKTAALDEVVKPLNRLASEAMKAYREACAAYEASSMVTKAKKEALQGQMNRAAKVDGNDAELERLAAQAQDLGQSVPVARRYKTDDGTVEKIAEILIENQDGILVYRDELSGLLRTMGKQGHEGERAFYLQAWNGTGNFNVDRIGRGSLYVPALCLSVLGGIQPGPLSTYVYAATKADSVGNDGLLQRFQLLVWPDIPKTWKNVDEYPNSKASANAYKVLEGLASLTPDLCSATCPDDDLDAIPTLRFNKKAQEVFDVWQENLENRLRSGELPEALTAHLAKYGSLMPSLALIFHLMDVVDGTVDEDGPGVSEEAAATAAQWCKYLESHAQRLYASAANPVIESARALAARISSGAVKDGDAVRDIYRKQWSRLTTPEEVEAAVKTLEAYGWIRVETMVRGNRNSSTIHINPQARQQKPGNV